MQAVESILIDLFRAIHHEYDLLCDGVYLFQYAPLRALDWAKQLHGNYAAVLKAEIVLTDCMDLLEHDLAELSAGRARLTDAQRDILAELRARQADLDLGAELCTVTRR